jgi:hypothetical protein
MRELASHERQYLHLTFGSWNPVMMVVKLKKIGSHIRCEDVWRIGVTAPVTLNFGTR